MMVFPAENARRTFADVLAWDENERAEIIDGQVFMMAPPSRVHQEISGELFRQLANFLDGKKCRVYAAPFAVRLFERDGDSPESVDTVVEPDISVVCDSQLALEVVYLYRLAVECAGGSRGAVSYMTYSHCSHRQL